MRTTANLPDTKGEVIVYQPDNSLHNIEVKILNETVRLSLNEMVELFERDKSVISRHIKNIFKEGELNADSVVANFATTASDGKTYEVDYYSLDVIISVGYRIKSKRGTDFRIWATLALKDYMFKGIAIHKRIENLEQHAVSTDKRLSKTEEQLDFFIEKALPRQSGIFFDGEVFDAHAFIIDLIKLAKRRIILIDNYIDESVLTILTQRSNEVEATIYTEKIEQPFLLALTKHNAQYPKVDVKEIQNFHDRFLIIDEFVYHVGASIKDLGKKVFAFSKL
ncbi:MAG: virulence RhuM family protein [Candidatus Peribacteria bacterium]|nr:virulence RhuM family protein [Candidatus Peribacteria bacterium]